jgi:hypothetical protein
LGLIIHRRGHESRLVSVVNASSVAVNVSPLVRRFAPWIEASCVATDSMADGRSCRVHDTQMSGLLPPCIRVHDTQMSGLLLPCIRVHDTQMSGLLLPCIRVHDTQMSGLLLLTFC